MAKTPSAEFPLRDRLPQSPVEFGVDALAWDAVYLMDAWRDQKVLKRAALHWLHEPGRAGPSIQSLLTVASIAFDIVLDDERGAPVAGHIERLKEFLST